MDSFRTMLYGLAMLAFETELAALFARVRIVFGWETSKPFAEHKREASLDYPIGPVL